jgi:hypothetical protein
MPDERPTNDAVPLAVWLEEQAAPPGSGEDRCAQQRADRRATTTCVAGVVCASGD